MAQYDKYSLLPMSVDIAISNVLGYKISSSILDLVCVGGMNYFSITNSWMPILILVYVKLMIESLKMIQ